MPPSECSDRPGVVGHHSLYIQVAGKRAGVGPDHLSDALAFRAQVLGSGFWPGRNVPRQPAEETAKPAEETLSHCVRNHFAVLSKRADQVQA